MSTNRVSEKYRDYQKALRRLGESLTIDPDQDIVVDGVIQRFEFTFELSWKLMQAYLAREGFEVNSPWSAIREAFSVGLLDDGDGWIDMMLDQNRASHTYDEQTARDIYQRIKESHYPKLCDLETKIAGFLKQEGREPRIDRPGGTES
ncbi:nucleotidyltransferase [Kyrpidia spormannii]|uniref:Nucleotidyltransferase n=1 Tax=Kyrpidia spormannii TaxID=2055160 RepID=A0A2K8N5X4_9BACL|nr:nucleotidyltransferase substrate binding protein [Kyrpidia spormannii]ATY83862.1 nucleotidyltransferase [Kyrpidia spormannii]